MLFFSIPTVHIVAEKDAMIAHGGTSTASIFSPLKRKTVVGEKGSLYCLGIVTFEGCTECHPQNDSIVF